MTLKHLLSAAAASVLLGGVAYAQAGANTDAPPKPGTASDPSSAAGPTRSSSSATSDPAGTMTAAVPPEETSARTTTDVTAASPAGAADAASTGAVTSAALSVTPATLTNGPIPDTAESRRKYGAPLSRAGKRSAPAGN